MTLMKGKLERPVVMKTVEVGLKSTVIQLWVIRRMMAFIRSSIFSDLPEATHMVLRTVDLPRMNLIMRPITLPTEWYMRVPTLIHPKRETTLTPFGIMILDLCLPPSKGEGVEAVLLSFSE